ncbi:MAG: biotin/lipoyl-containing protein [Bacteroidota bacterium]
MKSPQSSSTSRLNFQAKVSDQWEFELSETSAKALDVLPLPEGLFQVLHEGTSYQVSVLERDPLTKQFTLLVNGNQYTVTLADEYDQLVQRLGLSLKKEQKGGNILAPMPGLVLDILVEEGQTVEEGEALIVLEAMKMENVLKAGASGTVAGIPVAKGENVDKSHLLIEIE